MTYDRRHEPRDDKIARAKQLLKRGTTIPELAERLDCTERTAYRVLQDLGEGVARTAGNARREPVRYFLAGR